MLSQQGKMISSKRNQKPNDTRNSSISGFSLVEVSVTIAILVIVSVFGYPVYKNLLTSIRLWNSTQLLKSKIVVARTRAIVNPREHCGVYVNTAVPQQLQVFHDNGNNRYDPGIDIPYGEPLILPPKIRLGISSSQPLVDNVILFRGDGSARNGGTIELYMDNAPAQIRRINVLATTGRIKVLK